jgi:hypothetical protein
MLGMKRFAVDIDVDGSDGSDSDNADFVDVSAYFKDHFCDVDCSSDEERKIQVKKRRLRRPCRFHVARLHIVDAGLCSVSRRVARIAQL